jgi:aspartate kinase
MRALMELTSSGVEVLTFAQSFSERSLTLCVRAPDSDFARNCLEGVFIREQQEDVRHTITVKPVALVAIISTPHSDLEPRALASLGRSGAHVLTLTRASRGSHLSFMLPENEVDAVVRILHQDLGLA